MHPAGHRPAPLRRAPRQPARRFPPHRRRAGAQRMKNVLIVAAREFRQIASMRSFWLTLLILPIALALGPIAQRVLRDDDPDRVMVIDRTGGSTEQAIAQRF